MYLQGPSASAYVTYIRSEDALRAIQCVNNVVVDGRTLKVTCHLALPFPSLSSDFVNLSFPQQTHLLLLQNNNFMCVLYFAKCATDISKKMFFFLLLLGFFRHNKVLQLLP